MHEFHVQSGAASATKSEVARRGGTARLRHIWPHLRALLILVHVSTMLLLALPGTYKVGTKADWQKPKQQAIFQTWSKRLGVNKDDLEDVMWRFTRGYLSFREFFYQPMARYADYTGTRQGWGMFGRPRKTSGYFEISVHVDNEWRLLFRSRSDEHDWMRWQFEHNRVRKLLGRFISKPQQPAYDEFLHWVASRVAEDYPRGDMAKVALYTWPIPEPTEVRAGDHKDVSLKRRNILFLRKYRSQAATAGSASTARSAKGAEPSKDYMPARKRAGERRERTQPTGTGDQDVRPGRAIQLPAPDKETP